MCCFGNIILIIASIIIIRKLIKTLRRRFTKINFSGKLIWLTGASSGIGKQLAVDLSKLGASLILSSRNAQELEKIKQQCKDPSKVSIVTLDMSKPVDVLEKTTNFISQLEKDQKKIDIVIENAGISCRGIGYKFDFDNHLYLTNVNYLGPVAHTKNILAHMVKNKSGQLVITNSVCGKLAPGFRSSYVGSKHALTGYYDSIRAELKDDNIFVTQLFPSYVLTQISNNALVEQKGQILNKLDTNIGGGMDPQEYCREAIYHIYSKSKEAIITKQYSQLFGIKVRNLLPNLILFLMQKNTKKQIDAVLNAK